MKIEVSTNRKTTIVRVFENPISLDVLLNAAGVRDTEFDAVEVDGIRIGGFSNNDPKKRDLLLKTFFVRCTDELSSVRLLRRAAA